MTKVCNKCGKEVSLLVKGGLCRKCGKERTLNLGRLRDEKYRFTPDFSDEDLRLIWKIHSSTGFRSELEIENYLLCKKEYEKRGNTPFGVINLKVTKGENKEVFVR